MARGERLTLSMARGERLAALRRFGATLLGSAAASGYRVGNPPISGLLEGPTAHHDQEGRLPASCKDHQA